MYEMPLPIGIEKSTAGILFRYGSDGFSHSTTVVCVDDLDHYPFGVALAGAYNDIFRLVSDYDEGEIHSAVMLSQLSGRELSNLLGGIVFKEVGKIIKELKSGWGHNLDINISIRDGLVCARRFSYDISNHIEKGLNPLSAQQSAKRRGLSIGSINEFLGKNEEYFFL